MTQVLMATWDSKAKAYRNPFFVDSVGQGVRAFATAVNSKDTEIARYPEDFSLFQLGTIDLLSGAVMPIDKPLNLGLASSFKEATNAKES